ncbi:MAG TPA: hypothetical protein VF850_01045 [Gemmatimonadaceae bacterium]
MPTFGERYRGRQIGKRGYISKQPITRLEIFSTRKNDLGHEASRAT